MVHWALQADHKMLDTGWKIAHNYSHCFFDGISALFNSRQRSDRGDEWDKDDWWQTLTRWFELLSLRVLHDIKYPWENNTCSQVTDSLQLLTVHWRFESMQDCCMLHNNTWEMSALMYWFRWSCSCVNQIMFPHRTPDIIQMTFPWARGVWILALSYDAWCLYVVHM